MKLIELQQILAKKKIKIFSKRDFRVLLDISESAAHRLLWRYTKKGVIIRLKGGLYALASSMPDQYLIANYIYRPSYISFDTALSFYNIIPETIYGVTSVTVKASRRFETAGIVYHYSHVKQDFFTGYKPIKHDYATVLMAEPEKALADYLYFVDLKKRQLHYERLNLKKIKKDMLIKYAKLFKRPRMLELIKGIYADAGRPARIY
ncbi:hypothetical protein HZC34_08330 [Candidatus Saganbacteria bacterium]|nr:hypothetical protein [Candidatus Saganbacteria bacterium]